MTALERIELSRACLRAAMAPPAVPPATAGRRSSWLAGVADIPAIAAVMQSVRGWWAQHPLRGVGKLFADATGAVAGPLARRHPCALVLVAGAAGAAMVWLRPWRWIFSSAILAGLLPQLASRAVSKLPLEALIAMLGAALARPPATRSDAQVAPSQPAANG